MSWSLKGGEFRDLLFTTIPMPTESVLFGVAVNVSTIWADDFSLKFFSHQKPGRQGWMDEGEHSPPKKPKQAAHLRWEAWPLNKIR